MQFFATSLWENGFAEIVDFDPSISTLQIAQELGCSIGAVVWGHTQQLKASGFGEKGDNTYGGNFGFGELPLHTDFAHWFRPPRYLLLRCVVGSPLVATRVLGLGDVEHVISPSLMRRALVSPRRRMDGKMFLLRMLTDDVFRWDQLFLKPQNAAAREVAELMLNHVARLPCVNLVLSRPGHAVVIDNWRALHGRSFVPAAGCLRQLERIYLEVSKDGNKDPA